MSDIQAMKKVKGSTFMWMRMWRLVLKCFILKNNDAIINTSLSSGFQGVVVDLGSKLGVGLRKFARLAIILPKL